MTIARNTLGKKQRLISNKSISIVFDEGKTIKQHPIRLKYKKYSIEGFGLKAAFVVPKKKIRTAVNRNKVKRRIKEAYRTNTNQIKTYLAENKLSLDLLWIYQSSEIVDFKDIQEKIILILQRLLQEISTQEEYEEKNK